MPEKILYYLGAGASAEALPLAVDIWQETDNLYEIEPRSPIIYGLPRALNSLMERHKEEFIFFKPNNEVYINSFYESCELLFKKGIEFGNIDTYAKFLYVQDKFEDLDKLKNTLSLFFTIAQRWENRIDSRYLPWLTSIIDKAIFPENIKILSWNYDFQVQLAASNFKKESLTYINSTSKYSYPLVPYYPTIQPGYNDGTTISLIHLNGIAGFSNKRHLFLDEYSGDDNREKMIEYAIANKIGDDLHFAWEGGKYHDSLMKIVEKNLVDTTIVVVIGYSFPFFNRAIDKSVFSILQRSGRLKKIYYQDPTLNGQQLKSQFGLENHIKIEHISQVKNFHIPFEY